MSLLRFNFAACKQLKKACSKRLCSSVVRTAEPKYPPILDLSPLAQKLRRKEEWHNKLKSHDTVEEKLFELNMPKYYGWKSVLLNETSVPYDFLPYSKFATRTHFELVDEIKLLYCESDVDKRAGDLAQKVRSQVEDAIIFEHSHFWRKHEFDLLKKEEQESVEIADIISKSVICHINRVLLAALSSEAKHLREVEVTKDPRLEASWFLGGINPSKEKIEERKYRVKMAYGRGKLTPCLVDLPVNEPIQYTGQPMLQLRVEQPLPAATELKDAYPEASSVPHIPYEPSVLHLEQKYRHVTTIPGFWPGDPYEFGLVSFHSSNHLQERPPHFGNDEHIEAVHSSAILASYAWLLGQACYQGISFIGLLLRHWFGFSTFHDPTYPLVTQTVMTDGRVWSFYLYQLNTTVLHTTNATENPKCNFCWGTRPMELYERIEDDRVIGLNENVLKQLIKMYLVEPKERSGVNMKPYLADRHLVAHIDYEERRDWLERNYKHLVSNRPRHHEKPEMYAWEKIFKLKFNQILQEPRLKWFETEGLPPDVRRLDHLGNVYKPKALREDPKNKLDNSLPTFFPGTNKSPLPPPKKRKMILEIYQNQK